MKSMEKERPDKFQNENWLVGEPKRRSILGGSRGQCMDLLSDVSSSTGNHCFLKHCRVVIYVYKHYVRQCVFWYLIVVYSAYWLLSTYRKLVSWGTAQSGHEACHFSLFRMLYHPFPSINNSHSIVVRNSLQRIFKNFIYSRKAHISFVLSVCPHDSAQLPLNASQRNFDSILIKIRRETPRLVKIGQKYRTFHVKSWICFICCRRHRCAIK
jgi:hypothetical protein